MDSVIYAVIKRARERAAAVAESEDVDEEELDEEREHTTAATDGTKKGDS